MSTSARTSINEKTQFSLRSLLCTMVTVSMVFAYVRLFGTEGANLTVLMVASAVCGSVLGIGSGRAMETLMWTFVGGSLALCCVLSADNHVSMPQKYYWVEVGVFGGAYAGYIAPGAWKWRIIGVLTIWLKFALVSLLGAIGPLAYFDEWNALFDALLTLPVLLGLTVLVEAIYWLQRRHHIALDVWAAGIVFAVIAGNFGAVVVWNLWYA
ncbi:hypothetical protein ETAA8_32650 [Anatilimnocola aggregata]|uniref:Uncharacterized protein n=1 Tax=Anatilimnocola aggregata TaxID=2528021 RepID=A0A517YD48_9BACT|nr:hypothetical protein [Anatilimnocola aggregata]QDU28165.1 hypothetical protein ETAA8_32650 [Anatilimnocola aggregata]